MAQAQDQEASLQGQAYQTVPEAKGSFADGRMTEPVFLPAHFNNRSSKTSAVIQSSLVPLVW